MKLSKNHLTAFIVFLLVATIFTTSASIEHNLSLFRQEKAVKDALILIKSEIQSLIESRVLSSNGLIAFRNVKPDFTQDDFETFVSEIFYTPNQVLKNITYITESTITHIYPYEPYQSAIGQDLSKQPLQIEFINLVNSTRKSILTGPVDLVQGGKGIIVRIPVLKSYDKIDQIAIVFDYEKLIESTGIIAHGQNHYLALTVLNPQSGENDVIWSNYEFVSSNYVSQEIDFEDFKLQLISQPKKGWDRKTPLFNLLIGLGTVFSLAASVAVSHVLSTNQKLKKTNSEIKYLLEHDELTNLYNRRKFYTTLSTSLNDKRTGFIALMDMDNFKNINDILGHTYGDKILSHIADILHNESSNDISIYRIGGDEFVFLCDGCKRLDVVDQKLNRVIQNLKINNEVDQVQNYLTSSIGVVNYPRDGLNVEELLLKAEVAMYRAKLNGKNQIVYYTNDLMSDFEEKIAIENKLRDAVQNEDFILLYQPIISADTLNVEYFEALIRLKDFSYPPNIFIPVAEETGMILPIGRWLIVEAMKQLVCWKNAGIEPIPIAINMSPRQIYDTTIVDFIKSCLDEYQITPSMIEIEITESVLLENSHEQISTLEKLKALGLSIALDDFGTGYSSLNYLTYMPVDKIKIDKSLKDRFIERDQADVLEGLIALIHGLDLVVVAEGVEHSVEGKMFKQFKCDYLQGYLFSKPVKGEQAQTLIGHHYNLI